MSYNPVLISFHLNSKRKNVAEQLPLIQMVRGSNIERNAGYFARRFVMISFSPSCQMAGSAFNEAKTFCFPIYCPL
jgi:hypothetical protein